MEQYTDTLCRCLGDQSDSYLCGVTHLHISEMNGLIPNLEKLG
jgi:hypothetical protein